MNRMKDWLIPSGHVEFRGDLEALLHTISRIDGTLLAGQRFRCVFSFPKPVKGIRIGGRGGIPFVFHCGYEAADFGFRVSYRVSPSFMGYLYLIIPLVCAYTGYAQFAAEGKGHIGLLLGLVFAAVFYPIFFLARKCCIGRFLDAFQAWQ